MKKNYEPILALAKKKIDDSYIENMMFGNNNKECLYSKAAVLFLLSPGHKYFSETNELYLILNKRSSEISQPSDLCCPGGRVSPRLDLFLSSMLKLPGTPLKKWDCCQKTKHIKNSNLVLLLATALRESFEEIKLNPLQIKIIGVLPPQYQNMTNTKVYPFVCWIPKQKKFFPNPKEVSKIIHIPLSELFVKKNYSIHKISQLTSKNKKAYKNKINSFPCFVHYQNGAKEIVWGITYRIMITFLKIVFNYSEFEKKD